MKIRFWMYGFMGLIAIAFVIASYFNPYYVSAKDKQKAVWYDRFCSATKDAIRHDRIAFESGLPGEQEAADKRFWSSMTMYHNSSSIAMCLDEHLPESPDCLLTRDWPCLAAFARTIERALP